jgi:hypothetical protein
MARERGEVSDKTKDKQDRKTEKTEKSESRKSFRLEKIRELTAKAYAVASKRKWLVFMIVAAIAAYLIIFKGGGFTGILDKIKGFL